ncbi:hypothetical protein ABT294_47490 [Nonomuraea sp. NPDC000554]|uniref:hypothetical protein n=1 Tax=Nonomuraea sp. NPDC000554 TaxID=3154259 RepID=UPI00331FE61E
MSEVVPLPSFGEVFFDARGQERCLRVTWHEGTLVLSLWRGEMCTASFRMPMDDVGRLLDTLDDGYAEATGEQPAVPAHDPGTEVIPGTGQYHRPQQQPLQPVHQQPQHQPDDRPTAALSPSDVLVARGNPARQDKLVASYGESTVPRDGQAPQYGDPAAGETQAPTYGDPAAAREAQPQAYAERPPFTGPQYVEPYPGDPYSGPQYTEPAAQEPFTGPQYVISPQYTEPVTGAEPVYQLPADRRQPTPPHATDPSGFRSPAADPYPPADTYPQPTADYYGQRPDPYGDQGYQHRPAQGGAAGTPAHSGGGGGQGAAGLGTPMHGIPGAGRRQAADRYPSQDRYPAQDQPHDRYPGQDHYSAHQPPPNPVDPLLALGTNQPQPYQQQPPSEPHISRPYVHDPMFTTGERLRPEQEYDDRSDRREW